MSHSYLQKYRTLDELLEAVRVDLPTFNSDGVIEPMQLIKVVQRVTYDLGLRIHKEAEAILEIDKNRAKLPDNFYVLNFALLLGECTVNVPVIHGRHTEERILPPDKNVLSTCPTNATCQPVQMTRCGEYYQVVETRHSKSYTYKEFHKLEISSSKFVGKDCINIGCGSQNKARIDGGFIYTNFNSGKIYLHYISHLEDEDGNLLVMDHPYINEYYEYAIKQRVLENMLMAGEPVDKQFQLVEQRLRAARNNALSFVNTPDFGELKQIWEMNRKAMYHKYYNIFK
jgi:hypothetical protein